MWRLPSLTQNYEEWREKAGKNKKEEYYDQDGVKPQQITVYSRGLMLEIDYFLNANNFKTTYIILFLILSTS